VPARIHGAGRPPKVLAVGGITYDTASGNERSA
jgi:hypothetical protein